MQHSVHESLCCLSGWRRQPCFGVKVGGTDPGRARFMASSLLLAWPSAVETWIPH